VPRSWYYHCSLSVNRTAARRTRSGEQVVTSVARNGRSRSRAEESARVGLSRLRPKQRLAVAAQVLLDEAPVLDPSLRALLGSIAREGLGLCRPRVNRQGPQLTQRRRQTLDLLLRGLAEPEIGRRMKLSKHTVHEHVKALYRQFGVHNRAKLLAVMYQRRSDPGGVLSSAQA
jgi:DNA-binding NarL/FixJ family response regulator